MGRFGFGVFLRITMIGRLWATRVGVFWMVLPYFRMIETDLDFPGG